MRKKEFSKKLLICDYIIFFLLIICHLIWGETVDFLSIIIAWIAQLGISSGFYYWKSKCENRTKVPIKVIASLPPEIRKEVNLTELVASVLQIE